MKENIRMSQLNINISSQTLKGNPTTKQGQKLSIRIKSRLLLGQKVLK